MNGSRRPYGNDDLAAHGCDTGRLLADVNSSGYGIRLRVDHPERSVELVADPDAVRTDSEGTRAVTDRDRVRYDISAWIDT